MSGSACIDLEHLGVRGQIACYVLATPEPALIDPGPTTTFDRLVASLADLGIGEKDLRHVVLTHIHLDHAGATGHLVERFPDAVVHVHEAGASHMVDPERLVASTRRTFGDAHDRLWGDVRPVPANRVRSWAEGDSGPLPTLRPVPTPGHIAHHVAYLDERDGTLFAGDAMGVVLGEAPPHPPTPPPAVDFEAWARTLDAIAALPVSRFGATHFGFRDDVEACRAALAERLVALERQARASVGVGEEEPDAARYDRQVREALEPIVGKDRVSDYFGMFPALTDWAGAVFYVKRNP